MIGDLEIVAYACAFAVGLYLGDMIRAFRRWVDK